MNITHGEVIKSYSRVVGRGHPKRQNPDMPALPPHPQSRTEISRRIRVIRAAMDLDQTTFASRCSLSQQQLANYENPNPAKSRRPNIDEAIKIRAATGFGLNFIFLGDQTDVPAALAVRVTKLMAAPADAKLIDKRKTRARKSAS